MGGAGPGVDRAAREIYDEWAACHHFAMYEDVPEVLRALHAAGFKIGLISNTQRCLTAFQSHFALEGLVHGRGLVVRSRLHEAAPEHLRGGAAQVGVAPHEAVMVGDSLPARHRRGARPRHARRAGVAGRAPVRSDCPIGVAVISTCTARAVWHPEGLRCCRRLP